MITLEKQLTCSHHSRKWKPQKNENTYKVCRGCARTYSEPLLPLLLMETKKNDAHFSISLNSVAKQLVWEIIREIQILQREDTFCWVLLNRQTRKLQKRKEKRKEKKKFGAGGRCLPLPARGTNTKKYILNTQITALTFWIISTKKNKNRPLLFRIIIFVVKSWYESAAPPTCHPALHSSRHNQ